MANSLFLCVPGGIRRLCLLSLILLYELRRKPNLGALPKLEHFWLINETTGLSTPAALCEQFGGTRLLARRLGQKPAFLRRDGRKGFSIDSYSANRAIRMTC